MWLVVTSDLVSADVYGVSPGLCRPGLETAFECQSGRSARTRSADFRLTCAGLFSPNVIYIRSCVIFKACVRFFSWHLLCSSNIDPLTLSESFAIYLVVNISLGGMLVSVAVYDQCTRMWHTVCEVVLWLLQCLAVRCCRPGRAMSSVPVVRVCPCGDAAPMVSYHALHTLFLYIFDRNFWALILMHLLALPACCNVVTTDVKLDGCAMTTSNVV